MNSDDNDDFSGADKVAKILHKMGITSQEFQKEPQKWIELAIKVIKSQEKQALDESGSVTGSIKGFFEAGKPEKVIRKISRKVRKKESK